jgi:hypothetical protein
MYFYTSFERRTYTGNLQNPSVSLEELRRRQSGVLDNPESLVERLTKILYKES